MGKRNKWRKSMVLALALAGGLLFNTIQPTEVHAEETSQQMIEKKAEIDAQVKKLQEELTNLQKEIDEKVKVFKQVQAEIKEVDASIVETKKRIEQRSKILSERMAAYQAQDNTVGVYLNVVLEAKSFADLMDRVVAVKTLMDADQELVDQQEADKASLEQQKAILDEKQKELQKQFQELQQKESEMEVKKAENEAKSLALKAQIATKQEEERLEAERKAAEEEAARLRALQAATPVVQATQNNSDGDGQQPQKIIVGSGAGTASSGDAISTAKQFLGRPYVWGGSNPTSGFDCSGLVQWSYKQAGVSLPRTASQQYLATQRISAGEARVGDLVFFSYGSGVAHVGIYLGNNTMIDAQNNGVVIESLDWWNQYLVGFGRIQ
ncbi:NlpC/P60 family protein [Lysinibacillus sp. FSL M8-0216]|uniref:Cell wall-associated hydrolase, NlpC family n=1 Tax=Lysinibacillus fusiformis TaxID=28031 RepID=A0A1H9EYB0_9BACI|nr:MULTISPECIES: C40 family peptidase [Lysinibacillus]MCG7436260.1 NlpC/P60 family protein [Lysinibacillus fusiformis]MED4669240.1 NlpC/P60 family protein [Lysinibacillus fusiformis]SCX50522.1 Cell wall-associated hydrolase, NlpC family [Lysinibacillus fusiformis]SCY24763.1 Cell wall-associated hydrolase, NlpC family [Lysinibacillus fusiformis]SDB24009.1 Cell wall-associated hydrolase, NlpC family [Lysinibacillus fusiformis]